LTRHGLGVHNKMHAQVGSEAWNVCNFHQSLPSKMLIPADKNIV
jgi:hypothetical protein